MRQSYLGLPLLLVATAAWGQEVELSLRPLPEQIAPGQGAFVEVSATFPDTCTFGPKGELTFALNIVADNRVDAYYRTGDPGACGDALTYARAVFGPLPFESIDGEFMEIGFTLERGDGLTGFGETVLDVVADPQPAAPEPGFWWNPGMPGHGLALDRQGRNLFGALFSYNASGRSDWRVFQDSLVGSLVAADLLGFENGNCLLCGEPWRAPGMLEDKVPLYIAFDGTSEAWLRIGLTPGQATGLQRFHLEPAAQTASREIPATVPDLTGNWVRVDGDGPEATVQAGLVRIERLKDEEEPGEVVFGLFETGAIEPAYTLRCPEDPFIAYGNCGFAQEIGDPGPPVYLVPARDIGTERIDIDGMGIRYLRVPAAD